MVTPETNGVDVESPGDRPLASYGSTPEEQVKNVLAQHHVAVFGRSGCPFTVEAVETFNRLGVEFKQVMMDKLPKDEHTAIHNVLKTAYKQTSVPYVFVGGEFVGGCDETKNQLASGVLMPKLYKAMKARNVVNVSLDPDAETKAPTGAHNPKTSAATGQQEGYHGVIPAPGDLVDPSIVPGVSPDSIKVYKTLAWFPEHTDGNAARVIGFFTVCICIIAIVARKHSWAHWMMLGLFIDALMRLLYGGGPSPLGQLSKLCCVYFKPRFVPGFPKQFAALAATMLSGLSALFFLLSFDDDDNIAACCFAGILCFFAFLESALDWCAGCWMFGLAVQYGLLPKTMYTIATSSKNEVIYGYDESIKKVELIPCEVKTAQYPGYGPTNIDYRYKTKKTDDSERQEHDVIKHTKITHFQISLGLIGLAVVWKVAAAYPSADNSYLKASSAVSQVWQIVAVVVFCLQVVMYGIKAFKYPQKVVKEWQCPLRGNAFAIPSIFLVLLSYCIYGEFENSETLAKVLYWIGAASGAIIAIVIVSGWIALRRAIDHINSAWIIPPVGLFCAALVGPAIDSKNYIESSYFFFSFGTICWIMLAPCLFYKSVVFVDADDKMRPLVFIWLAPPSIAFLAYLALTGATELDFIANVLYFSGLSLGLILGFLFVRGHLVRWKFDPVTGWAYAFPVTALAAATIAWAAWVPGSWANGMAYAALVIATCAVVLCLVHTLYSMLFMSSFFTADSKYGPLSQQKLTHEAFRNAMRKMLAGVNGLDASYDNPAFFADFSRQLRSFHFAHSWHSTQEDLVLFNAFDDFIPGQTAAFREDHEKDEPLFKKWAEMVAELEKGSTEARRSEIIDGFKTELPPFCEDLARHLDGEEIHAAPVMRKYIPLEIQKQVMVDIWNITPSEVWVSYLPWVVNNLPTIGMRVKFIRCWLWAMPERAQQIGRMVALNSDSVQWERLKDYVPEIIPRGDAGHVKYF